MLRRGADLGVLGPPFGTSASLSMMAHAGAQLARSGTSSAPAVAYTPGTNASKGGLPDPSQFPTSLQQNVVLSDSEITRSFSPRVPPDILEFLLIGYEEECANRLISGFKYGFSIGSCGIPEGRADRNLTSCLEAPEMVDQYIEREQQAGRLAGPFPINSSVIRKISPIGLIPKKKITRLLPYNP